MAKAFAFLVLLIRLIASSHADPVNFFLKAQTYDYSDGSPDPETCFLTRHGYLTAYLEEADLYTISPDQELLTVPENNLMKSEAMGINTLNNTILPFSLFNANTSTLTSSKKITGAFSTYESDDGRILLFENPEFNSSMSEAVFVVKKPLRGRDLTNARVYVVTDAKVRVDWKKFALVDLVVLGLDELEPVPDPEPEPWPPGPPMRQELLHEDM